MNKLKLLLLGLLIFIGINLVYVFPFFWKLSGGSFVATHDDGIEVIYQGKTILDTPNNCSSVYFEKDLHKVEVVCDGVQIKYIKGAKHE